MRRLYITASEQPRNLRRLLTTILCVVIFLVIGDWATGKIIKVITHEPPEIVSGFQNVAGIEALWQFNDAGISPVAFTGSSQMQAALSPHLFDDEVQTLSEQKIASVNVSFTAVDTTITNDVIRNLLVPNGVTTIIYGIELRAINAVAMLRYPIFKSAPIGYALTLPPGPEQAILFWLARHSNLAAYQSNLRDWLSGTRAKDTGDEELADDRGHFSYNRINYQDNISTSIKGQFVGYKSDPLQLNSLTEIEKICNEKGIQCIIINMPIYKEAYQYITPQDDMAYHDTLYKAVTDGKLPLWDMNTEACRSTLTTAWFSDTNHLNLPGSEAFTKAVANLYMRQILHKSIPEVANNAFLNCTRIVAP